MAFRHRIGGRPSGRNVVGGLHSVLKSLHIQRRKISIRTWKIGNYFKSAEKLVRFHFGSVLPYDNRDKQVSFDAFSHIGRAYLWLWMEQTVKVSVRPLMGRAG